MASRFSHEEKISEKSDKSRMQFVSIASAEQGLRVLIPAIFPTYIPVGLEA
jgi:hypothetical protein